MNLSKNSLQMMSICIIGIKSITFLLIFLLGISCSESQSDSPHIIGQKSELKGNHTKKTHEENNHDESGVHSNEQLEHAQNEGLETGHQEHSENQGSSKNSHGDDHAEGHKDEHEESGKEFGPGKGVIEYVADRGIVLDPLAFKRLQVGLTHVNRLQQKDKHWVVPLSALIEDENDKGVYIKSGKWLQFVPVKLIIKTHMTAEVSAPFFKAEAIVTQSAALVRLAELNAAGASGEGHGH